ncbi:zinc knuckle [Fusarium longipes]|uniref:Zinc knuckle n=1 Tax=Fusarium longipes TaxID=694270 RepID=A0A395STW0_9HYPO|nr:zinc knuckle [Fusarium longipes]
MRNKRNSSEKPFSGDYWKKEHRLLEKTLVVLQMNAKMSTKRYEQILQGEAESVNGTQAHVIAFCDPALAMAFCTTHGYVMAMETSHPIIDADHPRKVARLVREYEKKREKKKNAAARNAPNGEVPDDDDNKPTFQEPITMSSVFFCVHRSVHPQSWRVDWHEGANEYLSATLFIKTTMGEVAIHSVHNPNKDGRIIEIDPLYERVKARGLNLMVGDFNLHDESWAGALFKKNLASPQAEQLRVKMEEAEMVLLTTPGTTTYTRSFKKTATSGSSQEGTPSTDGTIDLTTSDNTSSTNSTTISRNAQSVTAKEQPIKTPWDDNTNSCIDLTFASRDLKPNVRSWEVDKDSLVEESDHRPIRTILNIKTYKDETRYYDFRKVAAGAYKADLATAMGEFNELPLEDEQDIDKALERFNSVMIEARNKHVPSRLANPPPKHARPVNPDLPLHPENEATSQEGLPRWMKQKQRRDRWKARKDKERKQRNTMLHNTSQSIDGMWKQEMMAKRSAKPKVMDDVPTLFIKEGGKPYILDEEKHHCIKNSMWTETSDEPPPETPFPHLDPDRPVLHIDRDVTDLQVKKAINKLGKGKSPGPDQITSDSIKLARDSVTPFLTRLFKACMTLAIVPAAFKQSITAVIRKVGKATYSSPKSWRPIALLSTVGKIYERIITDKVVDAVVKGDLLPKNQYGAPGGSTTLALRDMVNTVHCAWSAKQIKHFRRRLRATLLGLDMASAFDTIPRDKLLLVLADMGFPEWILRIIHSFISMRTTTLKLPRSMSHKFYVNIGIPQGSPLSPILFLLFAAPLLGRINKHPIDGVTIHAFAYVDDTYLIAVSDSYEDNCKALEMVHQDIMAWSSANGITFSPAKYNLMHFVCPNDTCETPTQIPDIDGLKGNPKCLKDNLKVLGVIIDNKLTWKDHITEIEKKVDQSLAQMRWSGGSSWGRTLMGARQHFLGKTRAIIAYGCPIWYIRQPGKKLQWSLKSDQIARLERLQYKCLTEISGALTKTPARVLEKELHIERLRTFLDHTSIAWRAKLLKVNDKSPYDIESVFTQPSWSNKRDTPYQVLNMHASELCSKAKKYLQYPEDRQPKPNSKAKPSRKAKDPKAWIKAWCDPNRRRATINRLAEEAATIESSKEWEEYRLKRAARHPGTARPRAVEEEWGPDSLEYYKRMRRAQSTMLLHCRTEFIGLNSHLNRTCTTRTPDSKEVIPAACSCGFAKQTVYHMFMDCPNLKDARLLLEEELLWLNFDQLLTSQGRIAADWAISFFGVDQFKSSRSESRFTPDVDGN